MLYLYRALRQAFASYRWSILGSILFSLLVGVLWGANIGAVYPFAEIVLRGQSLHDWVRTESQQCEADIAQFSQELVRLKDAQPADEAEQAQIAKQIFRAEERLSGSQSRLGHVRSMQPYIERYAPESPFGALQALVLLLVVSTAIKSVCLAASSVLATRAAHRTGMDLQNEYFGNLLDVRLGQTANNSLGDSGARLGGDIGAVAGALNVLIGRTVREPFKMVACLAGAAYINWRLLLVSLLICPLAAGLLATLSRAVRQQYVLLLEVNGRMMGYFVQTMQGYFAIKAYGNEEYERGRFRLRSREVYRHHLKIELYQSVIRGNNEVLGIGVISISLLVGGWLVLNQKMHLFGIRLADQPMNFGSIMAFYAFLIGCCDPIRKLGDVFSSVQAGLAGAERVYRALERRPKIVDPPDPVDINSVGRDITFENVSFRYHPNAPVINGLNLHIAVGEHIALVGPNGCGKTTLMSLLLRFYDPDEGRILLGGVDLRKFRQADLRSKFGLVMQQAVLFNESVHDNIQYGKLNAPEAKVQAAARQARVEDFVSKLSQGYATMAGDQGDQLSGGQRQRVAVARALVRDPEFLVLDEATSQLDLESERLIHQSLEECLPGRTAILIAHRPGTLAIVDRIVVMHEGRVEASGAHEALLRESPTYRRLYEKEFARPTAA
jgi:ATP-binding cassette subfamily B protein/subfamily B ATP-binding cassette protein MsbA